MIGALWRYVNVNAFLHDLGSENVWRQEALAQHLRWQYLRKASWRTHGTSSRRTSSVASMVQLLSAEQLLSSPHELHRVAFVVSQRTPSSHPQLAEKFLAERLLW